MLVTSSSLLYAPQESIQALVDTVGRTDRPRRLLLCFHTVQEPWLLQSRKVAGALSCLWFTWFIIKVVLLKVHTIEFVLETVNFGMHVSQCI